jgi:hypothetical protein
VSTEEALIHGLSPSDRLFEGEEAALCVMGWVGRLRRRGRFVEPVCLRAARANCLRDVRVGANPLPALAPQVQPRESAIRRATPRGLSLNG